MPKVRLTLVRVLGLALCVLTACQGAAPEPPPVRPDDEVVRGMLTDLYHVAGGVNDRILRDIVADQRTEFVPVLVEVLRFEPGIGSGIPDALERLTGERFGADWHAWVEWLGAHELPTPPGFDAWKAELFATIDPSFRDFLYGGVPTRIRLEEIVWGGVRKDGIPALVDPKVVPARDARFLTEEELVFGVAVGGDARAYPHRILDWHEMANDVIGGTPIALAYCTLCGAGIVYATHVDGRTLVFGSSGFLFRSNKLMYDRETQSLWHSLSGEPVVGPLAHSGIKLKLLPVVVSTWGQWKRDHPETTVLSLDTGYRREYVPGAAYGGYFASPDTMFPVWQRSTILPTKSFVFALTINGTPKAYPLDALARERVVNDVVGGEDVVLVAEPSGRTVRAYRRGGRRFVLGPEDRTLIDERSVAWRLTEDALTTVDSAPIALERIAGHVSYWFGWYVFNPRTLVYGH